MIRIEDIDFLFPFLGSNLRALNERAVNLMKSQAVRTLIQVKEFIQTHPLISLFLVIFIVLGFLPFIVFTAFVSSSFLLVLLSALTVFGGTFAMAFVSFLVVLFPILMFGCGVAVFVYLTYCFIVSILQIVKSLRSIVKSFGLTRKVRRQSVRMEAPQVEAGYDHAFIPADNEKLLREELQNDQFSYLNY